MNLQEIKQKYKQILEQPESQQSEDEWQLAYSQMKNKRRKHILTQSNCVNHSRKQYLDEDAMLKVKQKLAQCLTNLSKKDTEIAELKQQNLKAQEQIKSYEKQLNQLKQALSYNEQKIIQGKIAYGCIQKDYTTLQKSIQTQKLDKQLMKKQMNYFENQMTSYQKELKMKDRKIKELSESMKNYQKYKNTNTRLKADVSRLKQLLSQTEKYKIFASSIEYKHYLGKTCKQHQCWFSQDLVIDAQNFLKKQQPGKVNKQFFNSLVKFVNRHIQEAKKKAQKKTKKICSSRIKQIERKHNHSLNFMQIRQDTLKKSVLRSSMCKSRKTTVNDSKRCTQSFIYDRLQKSLLTHEMNHSRDLCAEMFSSFRKGLTELLNSKQIKKKKIMRLLDWLVQGVLSIFPNNIPNKPNEIQINTDSIKIVQ